MYCSWAIWNCAKWDIIVTAWKQILVVYVPHVLSVN